MNYQLIGSLRAIGAGVMLAGLILGSAGCGAPEENAVQNRAPETAPGLTAADADRADASARPSKAETAQTTEKPAPTPPRRVEQKPQPAAPKVKAGDAARKPGSLGKVYPVLPRTTPTDSEEAAEQKRREAEDLIYATIRVKMEEMLEKRRQLLAAGKPLTDVEIVQLEQGIQRARGLLLENGEEVDPIDPPLPKPGP